jgi:hypothetical protein
MTAPDTPERAGLVVPRVRILAVVGSVSGAVGLVVATIGASGERSLDAQISWLNLAVVATVVAAATQAGLLVSTRRSVSVRLAGYLASVAERQERVMAAVGAGSGAGLAESAGQLVTWADHGWVHQSSCVLLAGRASHPADDVERHEPCLVCRPEVLG